MLGVHKTDGSSKVAAVPVVAGPMVREPKLLDRLRETISRVGLTKHATCRTFRHSFGTHMLEGVCDIRLVQEALGYSNVKTGMIHTRVLNRGPSGVRSPVNEPRRGVSYDDPHNRPDRRLIQRQLSKRTGCIASATEDPVVFYTDRDKNSPILCGSI